MEEPFQPYSFFSSINFSYVLLSFQNLCHKLHKKPWINYTKIKVLNYCFVYVIINIDVFQLCEEYAVNIQRWLSSFEMDVQSAEDVELACRKELLK